MKYILSIDQGTSSCRAVLFDQSANSVASSQKEFTQFFPNPSWVEHDAEEIYSVQSTVINEALAKAGITAADLSAVGITNQRETTVVWDRRTSKPIHNAIVWQDRRTADYCNSIESHADIIQQKTGLVLDAYFSASKIKYILDNVEGARALAADGHLAFGTIDSWLMWKLSNGKIHATDVSNASRTMLFNIHSLTWDDELLELFDIPKSILPNVKASVSEFGKATSLDKDNSPSIFGVAGDQQAALFGQQCVEAGMVKNTYGTGCFIVMNTGNSAIKSNNKMLSTIAWQIGAEVTYALEGSVFMGGATIQYLRDDLGLITDSSEVEALATEVDDNGGVYFIPALVGLGSPHWQPNAKGTIFGLSRGTGKAHIARASLEAIALQTYDVIEAMEKDAGTSIKQLRVDGGATRNNLLMQFQSDVLQCEVIRPSNTESTVLGAAMLAGLGAGIWTMGDLAKINSVDRSFAPSEQPAEVIDQWTKYVGVVKDSY